MTTPVRAGRYKVLVEKIVRVPDALAQAVEEFNRGAFFESHETLEEIWQQERGPVRNLYKGLIHIAVAFVHVGRHNYYGANRLFRTAQEYLEPYRGTHAMGFDVDRILEETRAAHDVLIGLGKANVGRYDLTQTPRLHWDRARVAEEARRWGAWGFDLEGNPRTMSIVVADEPEA